MMKQQPSETYTLDQAAEHLQVDRETIDRYIREGKLIAVKVDGRSRVPRRSLEMLLWTMRTQEDISLREYTDLDIAEFLATDQLDEEAQAIAGRFRSTDVTG